MRSVIVTHCVNLSTPFLCYQIKISTTFPALCRAEITPATTFLQSTVHMTTIDYHGQPRTDGGDPIEVLLKDSNGDECHFNLHDNQNGKTTSKLPKWIYL